MTKHYVINCWTKKNKLIGLSRFDFILKYIPEAIMRKADGLSKRLDWKVGIENDNKNQKLIKEEWICNLAIEESEVDII